MFEHFTETAIKAIMLAQEEARRLGHNLVGTEQILLGLIEEGTGVAGTVLKNLGITLEKARTEVENIIGRGFRTVPAELPFTPKAKRLFEQSFKEARRLGHNLVGTEQILLGLLGEGKGIAAIVLNNFG
ncbi:MAG: ATP-dependent Clp protease ATP-binding subunit ClpC, partial [Coleofasciculus sp. Co-bin14]|nr:ATP-dependent Clp protease ATP-binding subunit ClpC [Coleofasciculus sp. Co-bin14]